MLRIFLYFLVQIYCLVYSKATSSDVDAPFSILLLTYPSFVIDNVLQESAADATTP
jgi:hypothetical protein